MSFLEGFLDVQAILQKYFPLPIVLDKWSLSFHSNCTLFYCHPLKLIWRLEKYTVIYFILYSQFYLLEIFLWGQASCQICLLMEILMCALYIIVCPIVLVTIITNERYSCQCSWVISSYIQMQIGKPTRLGWFHQNKALDRQHTSKWAKYLAYAISLGILAFPLIALGFSISKVRDPIQNFLYHLISKRIGCRQFYGNVIGGAITFLFILYSCCITLSYLLLILSGGEATSKLVPLTFKSFPRGFSHSRHTYNQLCIVIAQVNEDLCVYVPMLITCGMGLCIWGLYSAIELGGVLPWMVYVSGYMMTAMVYSVIAMLAPVAALPLKRSKKFHYIWRQIAKRKLMQKELSCCRLLYYTVGPFFKVTVTLVLEILVGIVNWTFSLIILTARK